MAQRARHHTNAEGLEGIRADNSIQFARGWGNIATGVHVEVEPFGTAIPPREEGQSSPRNDMGCAGERAFVEFDAPQEMVRYSCGSRNTGIIPSDRGMDLTGRNAVFVQVRRFWWEFWRTSID